MIIEVESEAAMKKFGARLGANLVGGESIELVGDVGAGKTTLTKGLALGLGVDETVQSPSFTISRLYEARDNLRLAHYDFYRLDDAGIMSEELTETASDQQTVTVIEWADIVKGVLPKDHLTISILAVSENNRSITINASGEVSQRIMERLI